MLSLALWFFDYVFDFSCFTMFYTSVWAWCRHRFVLASRWLDQKNRQDTFWSFLSYFGGPCCTRIRTVRCCMFGIVVCPEASTRAKIFCGSEWVPGCVAAYPLSFDVRVDRVAVSLLNRLSVAGLLVLSCCWFVPITRIFYQVMCEP